MRHYRRNADEGLRRAERAATSDPEAANRLMVEKIRHGRSADITLGEFAMATPAVANQVLASVPPAVVRQFVRAALEPDSGFHTGTPVEAGMIDAFSRYGAERPRQDFYRPGLPPRVATPEVVRELIALKKRDLIDHLDFYVTSLIFLLPQKVSSNKWGPVLHLRRAYGWLEEEFRATPYTGILRVDGARGEYARLGGAWILADPWQFDLEESMGE
jgi:hypothetical protein